MTASPAAHEPSLGGVVSEPAGEPGLGELFARLVEDARAWLGAEVDYWRAYAAERLGSVYRGVALGAAALMLGQAATVMLLIGIEIVLAQWIGHLFATLIVVTLAAVGTALLARAALERLRRLIRPDMEEEE